MAPSRARPLAIRCGRVLAFGLIILLFHACAVSASNSAELREVLVTLRDGKDYVRVFPVYEENPVIGRFGRSTSDSLWVKPPTSPAISIATADVIQLDSSPKQGRATLVGTLLGALVGVAVTAAMVDANDNSEAPVALIGIFLVPVTTMMGALAGSGVVDYHWETRWKRDQGG